MSGDPGAGLDVESLIEEYITKEIAPNPELLPIGKDTELIESGILDSLSMLRLVTYLEDRFAIKVAPEDVVRENFETVGTIHKFIDEKRGTPG